MDSEVSGEPARKKARASTVNAAVEPRAIVATMGVDPTPQFNVINSAKPNITTIPRTVAPPKAVEGTQTPSGKLLPPVVLNNKQLAGEKLPTNCMHQTKTSGVQVPPAVNTSWNKLVNQHAAIAKGSKSTYRVLLIFSGPKDHAENLQHAYRKLNIECDAYDICDGHDLCDDAIWDPIEALLRNNHYDALFACPPCSSYSRLLGSDKKGPKPVRGTFGKDRYGLPNLSIIIKPGNDYSDAEYVRRPNLMVDRHLVSSFVKLY